MGILQAQETTALQSISAAGKRGSERRSSSNLNPHWKTKLPLPDQSKRLTKSRRCNIDPPPRQEPGSSWGRQLELY